MGRFDVFRSLVRSAARAGAERVRQLPVVQGVQKAVDELRARRVFVTESAMSAALARAPGVVAVTVALKDGAVRLDAAFEEGEGVAVAIRPDEVRFAPRGAKEVYFSVEPPETVADPRIRELVGTIAGVIARALWGPLLGARGGDDGALVEGDGARLRADLRTVPAVRAMLDGSPLAVALDVIAIESFEIAEGTLHIKVGLPVGLPM